MTTETAPALRFVDAFAGCGGLSLGLSQAGLKGQFAIEHDLFAFETFKANFLSKDARYQFNWPQWLPISPIGIDELLSNYRDELSDLGGKIDLLAGGPPCQGFSSAGRRRADDPRNQLFRAYIELVELLKPAVVLVENVKGFTVDFGVGSRRDNYSDKLVEALSHDYQVSSDLINLSRFGVPQNRVRYFVLAFRNDIQVGEPFEALKLMLPRFLRSIGLQAPVSSYAAICDLEVSRFGSVPSTETKGFEEIKYCGPRTKYQRLMATPGGPSDLRLARHTNDVSRRFAKLIELCHAEGRLNTSIGERLRKRFGLKKHALRVLDPDHPSPTITSMPDDLLHYKEPRILTVRENARLQSFPDWFAFKGKYTTGGDRRRHEVPRYTQVANAVPPLAGYALGVLIADLLTRKEAVRSGSKKSVAKTAELSAQRQKIFA